ncbi:fibronectin type III domain-containing protein [Arsukibacterium indicum]|uniref:Fibronectin type III domain-containing protein n=1 Tax=Arsukibacterium indicum TaxID=2848612 RepID=A0ABS6MH88_9GAMM|nr:fibronectin type III domain-containing protein [Arsukibacterium indicum]MBV2128153.1 fibronectin type III domain-containing protein [Arsukibacterium indicum]
MTVTAYAENDLNGTPLAPVITRSCPASNANNWHGLFGFAIDTDYLVRYMAIGTGADLPDPPPSAAEPVLTLPTGAATGETTASGSVTTDTASGTLYAAVTTSAMPPSKPDIIAGTGAAYATNQAVTATGVQNVNATGLTAETTYYWHFLHNDSNVATSDSFTTDSVPVTPPATAPTGLAAAAQSDSVIRLTWNALSGATGYKIRVDGVDVTDVGNVLTFDVTDLAELTQYGFEVLGYNGAGDGPYSEPPVLETTQATPDLLTLITDFDAGNVSQTLTTITNPESASPRVDVAFRPEMITGTNGTGWTIAALAVNSSGGKSPVFALPRLNMFNRFNTPAATFLPSYTQDFVNLTQAPSRSLVGGTDGTIEFQFADPLPAGTVYILTHPIGQQAAAAPYAASLLANHPGVVSPLPSADVNGVYFTSPAELDENGRQCGGHDMYALKFEFGGSTTDGGPKRKAVISYGQHAMGESQAWWAFKSFIDYILNSTDAEAIRDRANFDYYVYFNITPNGIFAGHRRHNPTRTQDPNRQWLASPILVEIAATKNAIIADTGGSINVCFDFHGAASRTENFIVFAPPSAKTTRFVELGELVFGETAYTDITNITGSMADFCVNELSADFASATEMQGRGDTSLANYQNIGVNWAKTLAAADADGMFYTPAATYLPLNISGLPDGTYAVNLCARTTGVQIAQADISFVGGQAQYEIDMPVGTEIAGYIVAPPDGAAIYGVLTNA